MFGRLIGITIDAYYGEASGDKVDLFGNYSKLVFRLCKATRIEIPRTPAM